MVQKLKCILLVCRLEKLLAAERALDTVVWQLLASVICPGYTIHTVVALAHAALLPLEVSLANPAYWVLLPILLHCCQCLTRLLSRSYSRCINLLHCQSSGCHSPTLREDVSDLPASDCRDCAMQQMEPVKGGLDSLAMAVSLQGDLLVTLLDKSLPTMVGLAGEAH